jgi:hypothetical protein
MTYLHKTIDAITGEEVIEPYTQAELEELRAGDIKAALKKAEVEAKEQEKAALLDRLGITADEAKLLLS